MATPIYIAYLSRIEEPKDVHVKTKFQQKAGAIVVGLASVDTLVSITALILAILGTIQVIPMPTAAFASLYATTGLITLIWVPVAIGSLLGD